MEHTLMLRNFTEANKARNFLNSYRINTRTVKIKSSRGCGFGVRFTGHEPEEIRAALQRMGIYCIDDK